MRKAARMQKRTAEEMDFLDFFSQESLVLRQNNHRHESECPTLPYMTVVRGPYCTTTLTCTHHRVGGFSILKSLQRLAQSMSSDLLLFPPTARLD